MDKGIPQHSFIDSGLRHLFKYLRGDRDEDHLVAAFWNIAWALEQEEQRPEMQDIPARMKMKLTMSEAYAEALVASPYGLSTEGETDHD